MRKKKQEHAKGLAELDRATRTRFVCEVLATLLDVSGIAGDILDDDVLRGLAERLKVPFLAMHMIVDTRVTPSDVLEWHAVTGGKAVA
jgi:hypothetical protein